MVRLLVGALISVLIFVSGCRGGRDHRHNLFGVNGSLGGNVGGVGGNVSGEAGVGH